MAQTQSNPDKDMKNFLEAIEVMDDYTPVEDDMIDPTELDYDDQNLEDDDEKDIKEDDIEEEDVPEEDEEDEEKEDEIDDEDDDEDDKEDDNEQNEEITPQEAVFELLQEEGVLDLPDDFEFDGTPEGLKKALETTKHNLAQSAIESLLNQLPDDFKAAIKYGLSGGSSLKEFIQGIYPEDIEDPDKVTLDSVADQRRVLKAYYKATTKYNDNKIDRLIDRIATDEDELREEAEEALEYLKNYKKEQEAKKLQEIEQRRLEEQKRIEAFKENMTKAISKLQATSARRKQIKSMLLQPIEDENGNVTTNFQRTLQLIYSNPEHLAQLANILADYSPDKGLTLEGIKLKGGSEAIKNFQKKLDRAATAAKKTRKRSPKVKKPKVNLAEVFKNL